METRIFSPAFPQQLRRPPGDLPAMIKLILLSVLLSGVAAFAHAQQKSPQIHTVLALGTNRQNQLLIAADLSFIDKVSKGRIYGLLLGTLGLEKSRNPSVQAFAENIIRENQIMNTALTSIAQRKGVDTAKALDPDQRSRMQQLSQLSGQDFDCKFLNEVLTEHLNMLRAFQDEVQRGKEIEFQQWAADAVPILKEHIALGKKAQASLGETQ